MVVLLQYYTSVLSHFFSMVKYRVGLNIFQTGQYLRFPWAVTKVTIFLEAVLHSLVDFFYPEDGHSRFL